MIVVGAKSVLQRYMKSQCFGAASAAKYNRDVPAPVDFLIGIISLSTQQRISTENHQQQSSSHGSHKTDADRMLNRRAAASVAVLVLRDRPTTG